MRKTLRIELDKWYTPRDKSQEFITKTLNIIGIDNLNEVVEPSAGDGAFSDYLQDYPFELKAYDIKPDKNYITQIDFNNLKMDYSSKRLVIGNPPFGRSGCLAKKFVQRSMRMAKWVGMVLPLSYWYIENYVLDGDILYVRRYRDLVDFGTFKCVYSLWERETEVKTEDKFGWLT